MVVGCPAVTDTLETTVRNDVASAVNWYWPASIPSRTKFPCASLLLWRITAPAALVSVTSAPATVAPFGSRTLPVIRPASVATRLPQTSRSKASRQATLRPQDWEVGSIVFTQFLQGGHGSRSIGGP